jgi:hypothetical protein
MNDDRHTYRAPVIVAIYAGLVPLICVFVILMAWGGTESPAPGERALPIWFAVVLTVLFGAAALASWLRFARAAAISEAEQLIVRNPLSTQAVPWTEVETIAIEPWWNGVVVTVHRTGEHKPLKIWALTAKQGRARTRLEATCEELKARAAQAGAQMSHPSTSGRFGTPAQAPAADR